LKTNKSKNDEHERSKQRGLRNCPNGSSSRGRQCQRLRSIRERCDKDEAITEAEKYGKEAEVYGAKVQVRNAPPQYSFKDDPVFVNFDNLAKQRKQMLTKAAKSNFTLEGATTIAVTIK
jgi:hypothetical protein